MTALVFAQMPIFDWTINVGNILTVGFTLIGFGIGALGLYYGMKNNISILNQKLDFFGGRLINLENETKEIAKVLTAVAVQDERFQHLETRLEDFQRTRDERWAWVQKQLDELRGESRPTRRP